MRRCFRLRVAGQGCMKAGMSIHFESDGPLGSLRIDRPLSRNALTLEMWQAIPRLLDQALATPGLRVLTLRSAQAGTFSAGADIREMLDHAAEPAWRAANQSTIFEAQLRLTRFPLPTIAFVEGDCIGGGCGLALACDIRVATPDARFGITPAKLGLVYPFHDIKLLTDLVGPGQAKRLLYTGMLIDALEARDIGLVEVIASAPDMLERQIADASPRSNAAMKRFVRLIVDGQAQDDDATRSEFAAAFDSADFAEGACAFLEKRKAQFPDGSG